MLRAGDRALHLLSSCSDTPGSLLSCPTIHTLFCFIFPFVCQSKLSPTTQILIPFQLQFRFQILFQLQIQFQIQIQMLFHSLSWTSPLRGLTIPLCKARKPPEGGLVVFFKVIEWFWPSPVPGSGKSGAWFLAPKAPGFLSRPFPEEIFGFSHGESRQTPRGGGTV